MSDPGDPGWPLDRRTVALVIALPALGWWIKRGTDNSLIMLRRVHLAFTFAVITLGVIIVALYEISGEAAVLPIVAIVGSVVIFVFFKARSEAMPWPPGTTREEAAAIYRAHYFVNTGIALSISTWGFVSSFMLAAAWPYILAAPISLACLWLIGPTAANIKRSQAAIRQQGLSVDLLEALMAPTPPTAPS